VVDCTGDGDVAARAGAPYEFGRASDGLVQPMTLMFEIEGTAGFEQKDAPALYDAMAEAIRAHGLDWVLPFERAGYVPWIISTPRTGTADVQLTHVYRLNPLDTRDLTRATLDARRQVHRAVEVLRRHHAHSPVRDGDAVSQVQYLDMKTYMVGDILTKVDRASMAHALEVRVPFLDHKLMEWVSGLPVDFKLKGAEGKYMLKKALEPHLPHDIMYRRKMGFSIPLAEWFRGPLKDKLYAALTSQRMADTSLFDMAFLKRMADDHARGIRDYSASLWSLYMFEAFLRQNEKHA